METCMRVLGEMENPDYDKFFRRYARIWATYYTEANFYDSLNEEHLTCKPRINFILGQFDEFYNTYNIDETSPYYYSESDRLSVFQDL